MSDDLHKQFDCLSRQLAVAREKCSQTYFAWTSAAHELKSLEREQSVIWGKMLDRSITERLPETEKPL